MRAIVQRTFAVLALSLAAVAAADDSAEFAAVSAAYLNELAEHFPVLGTSLGDHRFDDRLDDVSADGRARQRAWLAALASRLDTLDTGALTPAERIDAELLAHELEYTLWQIDELREWAWNPMTYTGLAGNALYTLLAREFAPLPERLAAVEARLNALPALFAAARTELDPALVPAVHAETALAQQRGLTGIVEALVIPELETLPDDARTALEAAIATATAAIDEHAAWLADTLIPVAQGDFRLGLVRYNAKLRYALNADVTAATVRRMAERDYQQVRADMYAVARTVYAERYPQTRFPDEPTDAFRQAIIRAALELAYGDAPAADGVVAAARASLAATTEFVREHDLVRVPDDPVEIILMPEFRRGIALAYCDAPGPLDKGLATYYAVSPLPADWSEEQTAGFLREYNTRSIHNLTIHEAMPGHYLQLAHANEYPSPLRAVLQSGPFIEGWAVYTEEVMADAGYYDGDPLMRLIQLKWYLRAVINAIVDQAVHVDEMSRDEAMQLMIEGGFQEEREAAGNVGSGAAHGGAAVDLLRRLIASTQPCEQKSRHWMATVSRCAPIMTKCSRSVRRPCVTSVSVCWLPALPSKKNGWPVA